MKRLLLCLLTTALLAVPTAAPAENILATLEDALQSTDAVQPGLERYQATVNTERIAATISSMTAAMPPEMPRPQIPSVTKYWRRGTAQSLIIAEGMQSSPFMQQMVQRISSSLSIEPAELLLPPGKQAERQRLAGQGTVRSTATDLPDRILRRVEISFATPAEVDQAFYGNGLRLPQKGIARLQFDIDVKTRTVRELTVQTATGEQLLAEFRYRQASGGYLPERVRVTSPDGKIDDLLEITFAEVSGFLLPAKTLRILNRPDIKDTLEVTFSNYRVNHPFPDEVETRFATPANPAGKTP